MSKFINEMFIEHYRGFKEEQHIILSESGQVTFLVGGNNAGKSLVARLFSIFSFKLNEVQSNCFMQINHLSDYDFYNLETNKPIILKFSIDNSVFQDSIDPDLVKLKNINKIYLCIKILKCGHDCFWGLYLSDGERYSHDFEVVNDRIVYNFISQLGDVPKNDLERSILKLYKEIQNSILVFDPIRSFDRTIDESFFVSGVELIKWLKENKSPGQIRQVKKDVARILKNEFNLEAPYDIMVDEGEKRLRFTFKDSLSLSSNEIGTGYTMLYILLMEIERNSKKVVVIDEIESHLQPGLTRILMRIIKDKSNIQYIVATHSPAVMETSRENDYLYRFQKDECACTIDGFFRHHRSSGTEDAKILREVCNELGVIPGDALLTNCVIWVEGPSEIFWIRTWISKYLSIYKNSNNLEDTIIEGLHYSILMTGGGNIANYSFSEDEICCSDIVIDEKLRVLRINPNPFVIIDSDNANAESQKFKRAMRFAAELNCQNKLNNLFAQSVIGNDNEINDKYNLIPNFWMLEGKELENYVHPQLLKDFYLNRSQHSNSTILGADSCTNWDVYSKTEGVGKLLEDRGVSNVKAKSGTIIHKNDLAHFIYNNFDVTHFEESPSNMLKPNSDMIDDLTRNLKKLLDYIVKINDLK